MPLSDTEFAAIMSDRKWIDEDIVWREDEDHSLAREFRVEVSSNGGWPLFVEGRYNRRASKLVYPLILRTDGRICGLCMGNDHHNPQCNQVGRKHMHWWTEQYRDKEAYVPHTIIASVHDPVAVWQQFCAEAGIQHNGRMFPPPRI
jgi:hypothetical protein